MRRKQDLRVFVAEVKPKEIVGFAVGGLERENHPIYKGELWGIYILREFQRRGIGLELLKTLVEHLLNLKINSMLVWVLKDSIYRSFYEKLNGKLLKEKEQDFHGLIRKVISYGWLEIDNVFKKYTLQC